MFKQVIVVSGLLVYAWTVVAQSESNELNLDSDRKELMEHLAVDDIPKPTDIELFAKELLSRPLDEQNRDELERLASTANKAANFVGYILDEYRDYHRDNYRYEFVQKAVAPFHDEYVVISNRLKDFRNQAFFNLGKKAAQDGEDVIAFFYFRDVFRLSSFTDAEGDRKGMRYRAEIEMKKLLDLEEVGTFIHWQ